MLSAAEKNRSFKKQLPVEMEAVNGSNSTGLAVDRIMVPKDGHFLILGTSKYVTWEKGICSSDCV